MAGWGRLRAGEQEVGGRQSACLGGPLSPPPRGICPSSWAHHPRQWCTQARKLKTRRNGPFSLMESPGNLVPGALKPPLLSVTPPSCSSSPTPGRKQFHQLQSGSLPPILCSAARASLQVPACRALPARSPQGLCTHHCLCQECSPPSPPA